MAHLTVYCNSESLPEHQSHSSSGGIGLVTLTPRWAPEFPLCSLFRDRFLPFGRRHHVVHDDFFRLGLGRRSRRSIRRRYVLGRSQLLEVITELAADPIPALQLFAERLEFPLLAEGAG